MCDRLLCKQDWKIAQALWSTPVKYNLLGDDLFKNFHEFDVLNLSFSTGAVDLNTFIGEFNILKIMLTWSLE